MLWPRFNALARVGGQDTKQEWGASARASALACADWEPTRRPRLLPPPRRPPGGAETRRAGPLAPPDGQARLHGDAVFLHTCASDPHHRHAPRSDMRARTPKVWAKVTAGKNTSSPPSKAAGTTSASGIGVAMRTPPERGNVCGASPRQTKRWVPQRRREALRSPRNASSGLWRVRRHAPPHAAAIGASRSFGAPMRRRIQRLVPMRRATTNSASHR